MWPSLIHYLLALLVLSLYGGKVCPFLESLTPLQLVAPLAISLSVQWLLHHLLWRNLVEQSSCHAQVGVALGVEMLLFAASGLVVAMFNYLHYDFPLESGLKVLIGYLGLGFFIALDLALRQERRLADYLQQEGRDILLRKRLFTVSSKMALFTSISVVFMVLVLILVVNKDLQWLIEMSDTITLNEARISITKEYLFVSTVMLAYILNITYSYAGNLHRFFQFQGEALESTVHHDLSKRVPVVTNDEFGVIAHNTNTMIADIRESIETIGRTQDATILSLATLAEQRDNETGSHILRTQRYVKALALHLSKQERYRHDLDSESIELLFKSAPLHDIGKVGIPDAILCKPGKLTDEEFTIMKTHAMLGASAIRDVEKILGPSSFLHFGREIAESHHEKWDGNGYPNGLYGEQIPLSGRLMAVADVYDALISKRVYKPAFSHQEALDIILKGRGSHFDPALVDAFLMLQEEFVAIAHAHDDTAANGEELTG